MMTPGRAGSARLVEIAEPDVEDGPLLVEMVAVGVCGTDVEIMRGLSDAFDVIVECTGAPQVILDAMTWCAPDGPGPTGAGSWTW